MTRHGKINKKSQTSKECVYYNKTYNFWCKVTPHKSPTLYFVLRGIAITLRLLCVNMPWIYINQYLIHFPFPLTIIPMGLGIDPVVLLIVSSGIECSVSLTRFKFSSKFSLVMFLLKASACNISFVMWNIFSTEFMLGLCEGMEQIS